MLIETPYQIAKRCTNAVVEWLVETAIQNGQAKRWIPQAPKGKGGPIEVSVRSWVPIAQALEKQQVKADRKVIRNLRLAIHNRTIQSNMRKYRIDPLTGGPSQDPSNGTHQFATDQLKQVLQIFKPECHGAKSAEPDSAAKRFRNYFTQFDVEDLTDSPQGGSSDGVSHGPDVQPIETPAEERKPRYVAEEADDDEEERRSAVESFLFVCGDIRAFLEKTWQDYIQKELMLMTAATVTNAAIGTIRRLEEDLQKTYPKKIKCHRDIEPYLDSRFFTETVPAEAPFHAPFCRHTYDLFLKRIGIGAKKRKELTERDREVIELWQSMARTAEHDAAVATSDLVHAGLHQAFNVKTGNFNVPKLHTWVVMAIQLFMDVYEIEKTGARTQKVKKCHMLLAETADDIAAKLLVELEVFKKDFGDQILTIKQEERQKDLLVACTFVTEQLKPGDGEGKEDILWSKQPLLCGLWMQQIHSKIADLVLMFAGERGALPALIHLYETLRKEWRLSEWKDLERLLEIVTPEYMLLRETHHPDPRKRAETRFKQYCYAMGVPPSWFSSAYARKGDFDEWFSHIRDTYLVKSMDTRSTKVPPGYRPLRPLTIFNRALRKTYQQEIDERILSDPAYMADQVAELVIREKYLGGKPVKARYQLGPVGTLALCQLGLENDEAIHRCGTANFVFLTITTLEQVRSTSEVRDELKCKSVDALNATAVLYALLEPYKGWDAPSLLPHCRMNMENDIGIYGSALTISDQEWERAKRRQEEQQQAQGEVVEALFKKKDMDENKEPDEHKKPAEKKDSSEKRKAVENKNSEEKKEPVEEEDPVEDLGMKLRSGMRIDAQRKASPKRARVEDEEKPEPEPEPKKLPKSKGKGKRIKQSGSGLLSGLACVLGFGQSENGSGKRKRETLEAVPSESAAVKMLHYVVACVVRLHLVYVNYVQVVCI